jgi:hypothetical protein
MHHLGEWVLLLLQARSLLAKTQNEWQLRGASARCGTSNCRCLFGPRGSLLAGPRSRDGTVCASSYYVRCGHAWQLLTHGKYLSWNADQGIGNTRTWQPQPAVRGSAFSSQKRRLQWLVGVVRPGWVWSSLAASIGEWLLNIPCWRWYGASPLVLTWLRPHNDWSIDDLAHGAWRAGAGVGCCAMYVHAWPLAAVGWLCLRTVGGLEDVSGQIYIGCVRAVALAASILCKRSIGQQRGWHGTRMQLAGVSYIHRPLQSIRGGGT